MCYTGQDLVDPGAFSGKVMYKASICFNATGIDITSNTGVVVDYGNYLGWNLVEQAFGFVGGAICDLGGLFSNDYIDRAAKVRIGCCNKTVVYITQWGKLAAT